MGIRRQIYLDEKTDELLEKEKRLTGASVSELVRRAVDKTYGGERRLTWEEFFARPGIKPNKDAGGWEYDALFDEEWMQELDDEMDRHAAPGL